MAETGRDSVVVFGSLAIPQSLSLPELSLFLNEARENEYDMLHRYQAETTTTTESLSSRETKKPVFLFPPSLSLSKLSLPP